MKRILLAIFWLLLAATGLFASWYVLHQDIQYTSDVARDFLLLREISQKGIVLIGPSSSTKLFHGILWMYLNYPVYALSRGNPVASGWFWIFLSALSAAGGFYVAKKLFNNITAHWFTLFYSMFLAFHVRYFYNPDGAMLLMPFVFFSFVRFLQTKHVKFLVLHVLLLGAVIQFEMAIGIPLAILSFVYSSWQLYKWKKYAYLLSFLLLIATQANFIIFDIRHQFLISKLVLHFLTSAGRDHTNIFFMIKQRIVGLTTIIEFLHADFWYINTLIALALFAGVILQLKKKKFVLQYAVFLYFYIGFAVVSLLNGGSILYFYIYPFFPMVFLIFASLVTSKYKVFFIALFVGIYIANIFSAVADMRLENQTVGQTTMSWAFYNHLAERTFSGQEKTFGYFVFDPDIVAYQPKYALFYKAQFSVKHARYFTKEPITYLIIAPTAYHEDIFWKEKLLHITKNPMIRTQLGGYVIEKYVLSNKEMQVAVEPNIDPGLLFR